MRYVSIFFRQLNLLVLEDTDGQDVLKDELFDDGKIIFLEDLSKIEEIFEPGAMGPANQ